MIRHLISPLVTSQKVRAKPFLVGEGLPRPDLYNQRVPVGAGLSRPNLILIGGFP
jgi:hypothetical protein